MPHCRHITQVSRNQTKTNSIGIHPPYFLSKCLLTTTGFRRIPQLHHFALWLVLSGNGRPSKPSTFPHPRFSYHTGRESIHRFHESVDEAAHTWNQFTRICLWSSMCPCRVSCAEWTHICCRGKLRGLYSTVPFHQAENCRTAAWVVLYRGTLGRPPFCGRDMIGPGSKIRLFDTALALRYTGFEQPTLYAELGRPIYRENGYHFFGLTPHLCVVTSLFVPICLDRVVSLVAIRTHSSIPLSN